jgi:hypothetical protein
MHTGGGAATQRRETAELGGADHDKGGRRFALRGGGTDGNEQLTAITSVMLLVLLAVIGVTIPLIGQLMSVHLFVGLLLIGPVALKMASTGYRFMRYYTHDEAYRRKGPPELIMRLIAPVAVVSTVVVFVSPGAVVGGLVLAIVLIPQFAAWTAAGVLHHHHQC